MTTNPKDLEARAKAAQEEADRADTARIMAALSVQAQTMKDFDFSKIKEIESEAQQDDVSPAALLLAARHLGARPLINPQGALTALEGLTGMSPAAVNARLRLIVNRPSAAQMFARAQIAAERDTVAMIAGMLLAVVSA